MKRAAPLAASALSALSLAALTACGGDTEPDGAAGGPRPSASRAEQLTPERQLADLMVTPADVDGFSVEEPGDDFLFAGSPEEVTLDQPVCAPLAHAMNQLPLGDPRAGLTRVLAEKAKGLNGAHTYITLTAYGDGGARSAVAGVKKAVESCGAGFTAEAGGGTSAYDSVTAEEVAPAGDEALGFEATMTFRGASHTLHTEVVRDGDVVGVYFSVNGLAVADAEPSDAKLPPSVVQAQNARLK